MGLVGLGQPWGGQDTPEAHRPGIGLLLTERLDLFLRVSCTWEVLQAWQLIPINSVSSPPSQLSEHTGDVAVLARRLGVMGTPPEEVSWVLLLGLPLALCKPFIRNAHYRIYLLHLIEIIWKEDKAKPVMEQCGIYTQQTIPQLLVNGKNKWLSVAF